MMKNKITRYMVNGVALAALAAIGITAFQLGTSPEEEIDIQEKILVENDSSVLEETSENAVDAGTDLVTAEMMEGVDLETGIADAGEMVTEQTVLADGTENISESIAAPDSISEGVIAGEDVTVESATMGAVNTTAQVWELPELNFSEETSMEWPVHGNILLDYSMDQTTYFPTLDQYKLSSAIAVQAVEEAPVMAAANGKVFSIEQDAWTGTTVTMELGNGYQAIYGQLKDLAVAEGDTVKKGSIIGYISAPTKYYSSEGSNLYYAMKLNGEPIDPIMYLP